MRIVGIKRNDLVVIQLDDAQMLRCDAKRVGREPVGRTKPNEAASCNPGPTVIEGEVNNGSSRGTPYQPYRNQ